MSDAAAIERFAALLEEGGTGRHHRRADDTDAGLSTLVDVVRALARVEQARPRPQFREQLRARLVEACDLLRRESSDGRLTSVADTEQPVPPRVATPSTRDRQSEHWPVNAGAGVPVAPRPRRGADDLPGSVEGRGSADEKTQIVRVVRPRWGGRARLAALVGVATGALAVSGVALASGNAVPGDPLYSLKRSGEHAQLIFAGSDADRGRLHLDFARSRLVEARQVPPEAVAGVLADMDREVTEGIRLLFTVGVQTRDTAPIESVTAFVRQQRADLVELRAQLGAANGPVHRSLALLAAVEVRANELRAALADGCATVMLDDLGPRPVCAAQANGALP
jgi:hypothetical protein